MYPIFASDFNLHRHIKGLAWVPDATKKNFQYKDPSGNLMMLPSDIVLIEDAGRPRVVLTPKSSV
jgi:hypothetical protein